MREGRAYESDLRSLPDVGDDLFKGFPERLCSLFLQAGTNIGLHCTVEAMHCLCSLSSLLLMSGM